MTAAEAKKTAIDSNERNTHFEFCMNRIKDDAHKGKFQSVFNCPIDKKAQRKLIEMGYNVMEDDYNDLYISW